MSRLSVYRPSETDAGSTTRSAASAGSKNSPQVARDRSSIAEPTILPFPRLRVVDADAATGDEPLCLLPLPYSDAANSDTEPATQRTAIRSADVLARAKAEHRNRTCPCCRRTTVTGVELADARINRNGAALPRTATLVGFHCDTCSYEWGINGQPVKPLPAAQTATASRPPMVLRPA